jgi:CheY-like chemotaxis protein/HPt (histidine-containing phosphotransfer) domain-containing protein
VAGLKRNEKETGERSTVSESEKRQVRILLAEDNSTNQTVVLAILEKLGYRGDAVADGQEAVDALKMIDYDLVLMDVDMPEMNGIEATKAVRDLDTPVRNPDLPIIAMTAHKLDEEGRACLEAGMNDFISKPVDVDELNGVIERHAFCKPSVEPGKQKGSETEVSECLKGARVLLVEDNKINQKTAMEMLASAGVCVEIVENGREAVQAIERSTYDAVLMDVQMPIMNGYEATRAIRENICNENLPIIAMTARTLSGDRQACIGAGMNDYVSKPVDADRLFSTLTAWIGRNTAVAPSGARRQKENVHTAEMLRSRDLPGIDVESALKRLNGNRSLLENLLKEFSRDYQDSVEEIKEALDRRDISAAQRLVHTMKGAAGNLGATDLYEAADTLESAMETKAPVMLVDELIGFEGAFTQVQGAAERLTSTGPERDGSKEKSGSSSVQAETATPLLNQLFHLLKTHNLKAEDCLSEIRDQLRCDSVHERLRDLEDQILRFDYKQAAHTLEAIAGTLGVSLEEGRT